MKQYIDFSTQEAAEAYAKRVDGTVYKQISRDKIVWRVYYYAD